MKIYSALSRKEKTTPELEAMLQARVAGRGGTERVLLGDFSYVSAQLKKGSAGFSARQATAKKGKLALTQRLEEERAAQAKGQAEEAELVRKALARSSTAAAATAAAREQHALRRQPAPRRSSESAAPRRSGKSAATSHSSKSAATSRTAAAAASAPRRVGPSSASGKRKRATSYYEEQSSEEEEDDDDSNFSVGEEEEDDDEEEEEEDTSGRHPLLTVWR